MATRQEILDGMVDAEVSADFTEGEKTTRRREVNPVTGVIEWIETTVVVPKPPIEKMRAVYADREDRRLEKGRELAQRAIDGELEAQLKAIDPALTVDRVEKLAADRAMLNPAMISSAGNQALAKRDFAEAKKTEVGAMDKAAVQAFDATTLIWP